MTDSQLMAAANRGIRLKGRLRKVRRITFAHAAHGAAKEISVIGFHCLTYFSYSIRLWYCLWCIHKRYWTLVCSMILCSRSVMCVMLDVCWLHPSNEISLTSSTNPTSCSHDIYLSSHHPSAHLHEHNHYLSTRCLIANTLSDKIIQTNRGICETSPGSRCERYIMPSNQSGVVMMSHSPFSLYWRKQSLSNCIVILLATFAIRM